MWRLNERTTRNATRAEEILLNTANIDLFHNNNNLNTFLPHTFIYPYRWPSAAREFHYTTASEGSSQ